ncbi:MAG: hypothetical protein CMN55_14330 [Sneathiella sp.]|jgi:hypothetical protein|uniref:hypothetical protein n=1 Tax=Sneathiella sp. TaxID=1964365 RepID=UPI000C6B5794|nr:hypothetical protein [Sneathiella sp.]MAL80261.1 hypothetical protein [Sneathiella sp.]
MIGEDVTEDILFIDDTAEGPRIETLPYDLATVALIEGHDHMLGAPGEELVLADSLEEHDLLLEEHIPPVMEDAFFDVDQVIGEHDGSVPATAAIPDIPALLIDPATDMLDLDRLYDNIRLTATGEDSPADLDYATSLLPPFAAVETADVSHALLGGDYPPPGGPALDFIFKNLLAGDES